MFSDLLNASAPFEPFLLEAKFMPSVHCLLGFLYKTVLFKLSYEKVCWSCIDTFTKVQGRKRDDSCVFCIKEG